MTDELTQEKRFGPAIRQLRRERGLSLEALSKRSGVSRAMLSEVERGSKSPTISTASRIARGLEISLTELLEPVRGREPFRVIRRGERPRFREDQTGFLRELVAAPLSASAPELARHVMPPDASSGDLPPYPPGAGKVLLVEQGSIRLVLGDQSVDLNIGDSVAFRADTVHRFDNAGAGECAYLLVIFRT